MAGSVQAEEYSRREERIGDNNVAITTYRVGDLYHSKAEIAVPGAGARIAQASDRNREAAEAQVREQVRKLFLKP